MTSDTITAQNLDRLGDRLDLLRAQLLPGFKSEAFCSHVEVNSERYFSSASFDEVVSLRSALASAFACNFFALVPAFSPRSVVAWSICAVRSCINISYACLLFISCFSVSVLSSMNCLQLLCLGP